MSVYILPWWFTYFVKVGVKLITVLSPVFLPCTLIGWWKKFNPIIPYKFYIEWNPLTWWSISYNYFVGVTYTAVVISGHKIIILLSKF